MTKTLTLLAFLPAVAMAQVTIDVEAGGSTIGPTDPYYDPMDITINQNDIVHWVAVSGTHNVYGELDDFPDNPVGFSSGEPDADLDFFFTFTVPGFYEYHCTQQGHAVTQHGSILVLGNQSVQESTDMGRLIMFPVPASGQLTIELDGGSLQRAEVVGVDGRLFRTTSLNALQRNVIDLQGLATGRYLLRLFDSNGRTLVRPFVKE